MITKKLTLTALLFTGLLMSCTQSSTGSGNTAQFHNAENYDKPLTAEVIATDLVDIKANFKAIEIPDATQSIPGMGGVAASTKLANLATSTCVKVPDVTEETGVKGSGTYLKSTTTFGSDEICMDSFPIDISMTMDVIMEADPATSNIHMETRSKMSSQTELVSTTTGSMSSTNGDFSLSADLDMTMTMSGTKFTTAMSIDYFILEGTYTCAVSSTVEFDLSDFSLEAPAETESEPVTFTYDSCELMHASEQVGRLEFQGDDIVVYDSNGDVIE